MKYASQVECSKRRNKEIREYGARSFTESAGKQFVVRTPGYNSREIKDFYNKHAAFMYAVCRGYLVYDRVARRIIQPQRG